MALNLSPFLEKLRIAGPDLIVGIMGVPIAFTFQRIAERANTSELNLSKTQLYTILSVLILCYLVSALITLDLTNRFDRRSILVRALQAILILIFVGLIFALGNEGYELERLNRMLDLCVFVILLIPLSPTRDFRVANRDDIVYLLLSLLMFIVRTVG